MMQLMIHSLKMDVEMLKQRAKSPMQSQPVVRQLPSPEPTHPVFSEYSEYAENTEPAVDDEEDLNLEKMERRLIEKALRRSRNRRKVAADDLGISERTLYRKIKDYGIEE
jgi:DNA-binding NtrC family response regulator